MQRFSRIRGFTLVEIGFVVALIGVLAMLASTNLYSFLPRYRLIQTSKELKSDLMALRMTAIQTNREARIVLVRSDAAYQDSSAPSVGEWHLQLGNRARNSTRWDTFPAEKGGVDLNGSRGTIDISDGGTHERRDVSLLPWEAINGPGRNNEDSLVFGPDGFLENPAGDYREGYITLTLINKDALQRDIQDLVEVHVAAGGMVRLETSAAGVGEGA